jgi:hypothetical protein
MIVFRNATPFDDQSPTSGLVWLKFSDADEAYKSIIIRLLDRLNSPGGQLIN